MSDRLRDETELEGEKEIVRTIERKAEKRIEKREKDSETKKRNYKETKRSRFLTSLSLMRKRDCFEGENIMSFQENLRNTETTKISHNCL